LIDLIPLSDLSDEAAAQLVDILNHDALLNEWLGTSMEPPTTLGEFRRTGADWQERHHAVIYCIWAGQPVGTISLSHLTEDGQACIGYWLASRAWGRGIASQAFAQLLEIARKQGVRQVSAVISISNLASLRIWRRYAALETLLDNDRSGCA
jgi:RimJ/RimL family protein N-acetyltransferase